ncbi:MAG: hypothetical protein QOG85_641 [Gaiellaceae bacterium]|jgi:hypothetical protein|nr:hypothetical protein [Gaiellaceae bacterium]
MAPKAANDAAKKKAAKQKKLLVLLGLALVGAVVFAVTTLMSLGSSPAASTTPAGATPGATATGTPIAATITPGVAEEPSGALQAFSGLGRRDPFYDRGPDDSKNASNPTAPQSTPTSTPTQSPTIKDNSPTPTPTSALKGAVISINGKPVSVKLGAKFGHAAGSSDSLFRLVRVSATRAVIGILGTSMQYTLNLHQKFTLSAPGVGGSFTFILERVESVTTTTTARH